VVHKVIIDADPGIGDAIAVVFAMLDPDIDLLGLTATGGVVSGQQATRNLQSLVELVDPPKRPRMGGSDDTQELADVSFRSQTVPIYQLHGPHGLGDVTPQCIDLAHRRESARVLSEIVRDNPHDVTLLTLGPMTNFARACERTPDLPGLLGGMVCCAGTVEQGGNVTATSEFNVYANPEAARMTLRSPATKRLTPLDVSGRPMLTFAELARLSDKQGVVKHLVEMIQYKLRMNHQHFGYEGIHIHEFTALATLTRPELFESREMLIDVETSGDLTRGMTVFDRRGINQWHTNIDVFYFVNERGVIDYFHELVDRASRII
jgi:inosine-uridine nucleoside N-ribohydrolase